MSSWLAELSALIGTFSRWWHHTDVVLSWPSVCFMLCIVDSVCCVFSVVYVVCCMFRVLYKASESGCAFLSQCSAAALSGADHTNDDDDDDDADDHAVIIIHFTPTILCSNSN